MKTALSMVALMVLLASGRELSSIAAEGQVRTSATPATQVYVRTDPAGAEVRLAGESKGRSPQLIPVPDRAITMTVEVELDGYGRQQRQVKIEGGRITRVEFSFKQGPEPQPAKMQPPSFGPVVEQILSEPEKAVAELLDLDTGRRAIIKEFGRNDRETHARIRQEKVDVMGIVERGLPGVFLFDCAVYDNPVDWEKITPQEVVDHRALNQNEPRPITTLATEDPSKLPLTCLFETREGTKGVLQLVGLSDNKQGVKIRYKLVRQAATTAAARLLAADRARGDIARLRSGLEVHQLDVGRYPTSGEGLNALQEKPADLPDSAKWQGPYLKDPPPVDPWGNPYQYRQPGIFNPNTFDVYSKGPDGTSLTRDDIGNWEPASKAVPSAAERADAERGEPRTETTEEGRRLRYFVRLVAGKDRITFEGKETTWEELPGLLEKIPDRAHTVLEVAISSEELTLKQKNTAVGRAQAMARQFDFEYLSFIGVHPLGSKGSATQKVPRADEAPPARQSAKKVRLPDADTPGTATVLDLASGEVFPFPQIDGPPDLKVFARLGKGDLFFDRVLGCPRGAHAMQWDGKRFVTFPPKEQIEDARAYELPALPCRLLITTAEKKHFDVTILAVTDDGGIDLEYRPADPVLVPKGSDRVATAVSAKARGKAHLPNTEGGPGAETDDFRRMKCILDLAGGRMLAFPEEVVKDAGRSDQFFAQATEGDLLYADRSLFCMRGGKAMRWDGQRFTAMEERDFAPSKRSVPPKLTRYELPAVPCRLLITTAEKKRFDVMIRGVGDDAGIDLEYGPADAAVVPTDPR